ncbi:MAG: hypothetical protein PWP24_1760, partial [Clostridiales bacterium]|nr:hypothetical protein [Clostridiales bacterium]
MKKRVQKISSFSLAIVLASSLLALQPTRAFATANVTSPTISVNANKNVDVALAVGKTSVDYSDFETQLKEAIGNKIPGSNINIMAATSVDTSTSSDFDWMEFDHSYNSATYSSINDFVDQTKETNGNAYNTIDRHVVLDTTNGTKLTFRGYGSHAYSDFMLLENDQTTNKTFQFDIKEYFAADALYNIGFFFNSNLTY